MLSRSVCWSGIFSNFASWWKNWCFVKEAVGKTITRASIHREFTDRLAKSFKNTSRTDKKQKTNPSSPNRDKKRNQATTNPNSSRTATSHTKFWNSEIKANNRNSLEPSRKTNASKICNEEKVRNYLHDSVLNVFLDWQQSQRIKKSRRMIARMKIWSD